MQLVRTCSCGAPVLKAVGLAERWLVDAVEVFPEGRCGHCHGTGYVIARREAQQTYTLGMEKSRAYVPTTGRRVAVTCRLCRGTGVRGEPVEPGMILVDHLGRARVYLGQDRLPGEAFHRVHACALAGDDTPLFCRGIDDAIAA